MMTRPQRKNNPAALRLRLLDCAATLIVDHGVPALTLENVAREAGVSKGGLLHHYSSKDALIGGLFDMVVEWFGSQVDAAIEPEENRPARFSRAYLQVIANIDMSVPAEKRLAVLILMLSSDPHYCARWNSWVDERLREHHRTDTSPMARTLRLAADGLWLSDLGGGPDSVSSKRGEILQFLQTLDPGPATSTPHADKGGQ
ncbi:MAG: TetR family transcriptional regulator [Hoeflea sp.]|uniref:TetR/AcrR family transcriptional regulator n=1 Tax=Hoeflea sp. TaxID=1940281 RepID=UPI000C0C659C|nr:TetR/AcrR family transcriptional regulator [Hoeflea sp.]PHR25281.1 MAG: TetR family transcriptional regulator [Hoeflea sp.]